MCQWNRLKSQRSNERCVYSRYISMTRCSLHASLLSISLCYQDNVYTYIHSHIVLLYYSI